MDNNLKTVETLEGVSLYDSKHRHFAGVIKYKDKTYDLREEGGETGIYRLTSEDYFDGEHPSFIKIDKEGRVLEEMDILGKPFKKE